MVFGRLNKFDVGKLSPQRIFNSYAMGADGDDSEQFKRVPFDSGFILTNNSLTAGQERDGVSSYQRASHDGSVGRSSSMAENGKKKK